MQVAGFFCFSKVETTFEEDHQIGPKNRDKLRE